MKIVNASAEVILPYHDWNEARSAMYRMIERAGRTCYKSEDKITDESAAKFIKQIVKRQHEAMLEHASLTVRFVVDRGISHELVRHRLASFAQESTRYCNYSSGKFDHELTFIRPFFLDACPPEVEETWNQTMQNCENAYLFMLKEGCSPQEARSVLPNSLKTEVIMTANMREWRHFLRLRAEGLTGAPHPQMLEVCIGLLKTLKQNLPEIFEDIGVWGE